MFHVDHLKSSDLILNYVVASFSEEWLKKMDANKKSVTLLFEKVGLLENLLYCCCRTL